MLCFWLKTLKKAVKNMKKQPFFLKTKEMVLHIRCTTEQRDTFARMGGSVWFRSFLDTLQAGFDRDVNSSSGEED